MARLDRLSDAKLVAQIGAVIGREFDHGVLENGDRPRRAGAAIARLRLLVEAEILVQNGAATAGALRLQACAAARRRLCWPCCASAARNCTAGSPACSATARKPARSCRSCSPTISRKRPLPDEAIRWWREARQAGDVALGQYRGDQPPAERARLAGRPAAPVRRVTGAEAELRLDLSGPAFAVGGFTDVEAEANINQALALAASGSAIRTCPSWCCGAGAVDRQPRRDGPRRGRGAAARRAGAGYRTAAAWSPRPRAASASSARCRARWRKAASSWRRALSRVSAIPARETMTFSHGLDPLVTARGSTTPSRSSSWASLTRRRKRCALACGEAREARYWHARLRPHAGRHLAMLSHDDEEVGRLGSQR